MKARSKSEMKRLYAMGIENVDEHLDWCAVHTIGVCSCKAPEIVKCPERAVKTPEERLDNHPASGASGPNRGTAPEVLAAQHLEALQLLEQACGSITAARRLLGDKKA